MKENRHVFVDFYGPFSFGRHCPLLDGSLLTAKIPPGLRLHLRHQKSAPECCSAWGWVENEGISFFGWSTPLLKLIRDAVAPLSSFVAAGCVRSLDTEPILKRVVPVNRTHTCTWGNRTQVEKYRSSPLRVGQSLFWMHFIFFLN